MKLEKILCTKNLRVCLHIEGKITVRKVWKNKLSLKALDINFFISEDIIFWKKWEDQNSYKLDKFNSKKNLGVPLLEKNSEDQFQ